MRWRCHLLKEHHKPLIWCLLFTVFSGNPYSPSPGVEWMFSRRALRVGLIAAVVLCLEYTPQERAQGGECAITLLGDFVQFLGEVTGRTVAHLLTEVPIPRWLVVAAVAEALYPEGYVIS